MSVEVVVSKAIGGQIDRSLNFQSKVYYDRIRFSYTIIPDREKDNGEHHIHHKINTWKLKGSYDIHYDISENFTLLQLICTADNLNNVVSIVVKYILYSNYKNALLLTK